jgi:membrane protease YdiL (CAAX protease family)
MREEASMTDRITPENSRSTTLALGDPPDIPDLPRRERPRSARWRILMPFGSVILALVIGVVLAVALLHRTSLALDDAVAGGVVEAVLLTCGILLLRRLPAHERRLVFATKGTAAQVLRRGIGYGILGVVAAAIVIAVGSKLTGLTTNSGEPSALHGPLIIALTIVGTVILAPLAEELIFRGFILRGFVRPLPFWWAAVASAALFGGSHVDVWSSHNPFRYMALVMTGTMLAWLNRTRGYRCGVVAHATNNFIAVAAILLASR